MIHSFLSVRKRSCRTFCTAMYPSLSVMLNVTKETQLAVIVMLLPSKKRITKPVKVTTEMLDVIPEIAEGLKVYNDPKAKDEAKHEAMKFISERVQEFLYLAIYPDSNAVQIGQMLGLPGYVEMQQLVEEKLKQAA